MPSFKITQMVPLHRTGAARALDKKSFKCHLLNQWSKINIISQNCTFQNCTNGSAPLNKRAARAPDKKYLKKTSPFEPLVQIHNISSELFLIIPSTKIAQMVWLHWTKGPPELQIRNLFKPHLLNHWSEFKIISQNCSSCCPLPKSHKWFRSAEQKGHRAPDKKYL